VLPLSKQFGWDRAAVVSIYSVSQMVTGFMAPAVGRVFDRYGPRVLYGIGLTLLGGGFSLAAFANQLWQFELCIGFGVGIAATCLGNVPNGALLSRWFRGRLTTAMSIAYSAFGFGILILDPSMQLLIDHAGWRDAYHWVGAGFLALLVPAMLLPWQRFAAGHPDMARRGEAASGEIDTWTLLAAVREPAFWSLFAAFLFTGIGMYTIVVQCVAYFVEIGFTPLQAASAWGSTGILLPLGMLGIGWLDGVIGRRPAVILSYVVSLTGIVLLWLLGHFPSYWLLAVSVLCFGSTLGSRGPLISSIALRLFRGRHAATIFGTIALGGGLGSAIGSVTGGLLHDWTGSYDPVIAFSFVNIAIAMWVFLSLPDSRH
jgi:MFS family permease